MLVMTTGTSAVALAVVVALVYLGVTRLMDLNEKESFWALSLLMLLGAVAAGVVSLLVDSTVLELTIFRAALAEELAVFGAVAVAVTVFAAIARLRGRSEINGLMDGVVYATAAGLGFAVGDACVRELVLGEEVRALTDVSSSGVLWTTALDGLANGVFGAILSAGFAASAQARPSHSGASTPLRL